MTEQRAEKEKGGREKQSSTKLKEKSRMPTGVLMYYVNVTDGLQ